MPDFDVAVVGGGIAGVSAAAHISGTHSVVLLEQESELAYHTTSRSAAVFLENEGGPVFHRLSAASRRFFETDHPELEAPLLTPLPVLKIGGPAEEAEFGVEAAAAAEVTASIRLVDAQELAELCPVLRPEAASIGLIEDTAASIDVMSLHQLYVRRARVAGTEIRRRSRVIGLDRAGSQWRIETTTGPVEAGVVVNAAGAWGDRVGELAGVRPIGLTPMRRTAFTTKIAEDPSGWPFIYSPYDDRPCYFKPEPGQQLLCSLSDESPSEPCDARAREIDVAQAIDNINALTTLDIRSVSTTWAGLRTFAPDRNPVFGWDDEVDGFLWMVGQGGCGIVSSPAAGEIAAALVAAAAWPAPVAEHGLDEASLAPRR